ncbi:MAG: tetratricopeptide repeat protein, partial [Gemmatimonadales bacterium]
DGEPTPARAPRFLTPDYAAPEQVRGEPVTAAADGYSLGVILFELLTGLRPPWQRRVTLGAPESAVEAELVPPSRLAPPGYRKRLVGDLDTIVLKALAPAAGQRYASVDALREDVERFLAGRPIAARPASPFVRARKFARRHRGAVAAGVLAAVLAIGYVVTLAVQARRIAAERDRAVAAQRRAESVVGLLTDLFESGDPMAAERRDTLPVGTLLSTGADRVIRELGADTALQAELLAVLAGVNRSLGRVDEAVALAGRSVALRRADPKSSSAALAASLAELGRAQVDRSALDSATANLREAVGLLEPADTGEALIAALQHLGHALMNAGQLDSATHHFNRAIALANRAAPIDSSKLGELYNHRAAAAQRRAAYDTALADIRQAIIFETAVLGAEHPRTLTDRVNLGFLTDRTGHSADAVSLLEETVALIRRHLPADHPLIASALLTLSRARLNTGDVAGAARDAGEAVAFNRRRLGGRHLDLAIALDYFAATEQRQQHFAAAEAALVEAADLFGAFLGLRHPSAGIARARLAAAQCDTPGPDRRFGEVLARFAEALTVIDSAMPPAHPQRVNYHVARGRCLAASGAGAAAERELSEWFERAVASLPATERARRNAATGFAALYRARGDTARAREIEERGAGTR